MTSNEITTDEYFGGCPECGQTDGYLNLERTHWFFCDRHRTKWCAGANLFGRWFDENEAIWTENAIRIWYYRNVEPIHPEPTEEERRAKEELEAVRAQRLQQRDGDWNLPLDPDPITGIDFTAGDT